MQNYVVVVVVLDRVRKNINVCFIFKFGLLNVRCQLYCFQESGLYLQVKDFN